MDPADWPVLQRVQSSILETTRLVYVFGKKGDEALLVTYEDRVYAVGQNTNGYLGLGDEIPRLSESEVRALSGKHVKGFTTGGSPESLFVIAYLQDGTVYEWGCIPGCKNPLLTPHEVLNLKHRVVDVACGISHCVALCEDGEIYTWGAREYGNLGRQLDKISSDYFYPVARGLTAGRVEGILDYSKAVKIACGAYFSVVVLHDKRVVSWGCNRFGQLGIGKSGEPDLPFVSVPTEIHCLHGIEILKVVCCPASVFALNAANFVFFWGNNLPSYVGALNGSKSSLIVNSPVKYGRKRYLDIGATYKFELAVLQGDGLHLILGYIEPKFREMKFKSINDVFLNCVSHMYQPLSSVKTVKTLSDVLASEFDNPEKSDLIVNVEDMNIYVHKMILSMRSPHLKAMLENNAEFDRKITVVRLTGHTYKVIRTYLQFLYTDLLPADVKLAIDLLKLSDEYSDNNLKAKCVEMIMGKMTATDVVDVYPLVSRIRNIDRLIPLCIKLASENLNLIVNSDQFNRNWDAGILKLFLIHLAKKLSNS